VAVAVILEGAGSGRERLADVLEVPVASSCEEPDERDVPETTAVASTMRVKEGGCDVCEGSFIALDVSLGVLEDTSEALLRVLCCVSLRLLATLPCPEMVAGYVLAGI
jgi:hypothetical protein